MFDLATFVIWLEQKHDILLSIIRIIFYLENLFAHIFILMEETVNFGVHFWALLDARDLSLDSLVSRGKYSRLRRLVQLHIAHERKLFLANWEDLVKNDKFF
jgi:hypothetical protein